MYRVGELLTTPTRHPFSLAPSIVHNKIINFKSNLFLVLSNFISSKNQQIKIFMRPISYQKGLSISVRCAIQTIKKYPLKV